MNSITEECRRRAEEWREDQEKRYPAWAYHIIEGERCLRPEYDEELDHEEEKKYIQLLEQALITKDK